MTNKEMIKNEMIRSLPTYERKSSLFISIFDAEAKQLNLLDETIEDVRKQFFVDTATWGLKAYEKELKIIVPTGSDFESRRAAVKAKMRSDGKVDKALLESVASAILRTVVQVEFDGRILFHLEITDDELGSIGLFNKMISDIKPAHLPMELELRVSSKYVIHTKEYDFPVPYKTTGTFHTAPINGVAARNENRVENKNYSFKVAYPTTGTFYCSEGGH